MNILLFGATGMLGQGALRECLLDPMVNRVRTVGRTPTGLQHPKLQETVLPDLFDLAAAEPELTGFDACFFCLGVSSVGIGQAAYEHITYDLPVAVGQTLSRLNPAMTLVHVSAAGADSTETSRAAWSRIKGRAENAVRRLPFKAVYIFRPGFIQPVHGAHSRTRAYRIIYTVTGPIIPLLRRILPNHILTTEIIARAMLAAARHGAPQAILDPAHILALART